MARRTTRAYNAGRNVHNFFAAIGSAVATGVKAVAHTVVDFGVGVKEGGPGEEEKKPAKGGSHARA